MLGWLAEFMAAASPPTMPTITTTKMVVFVALKSRLAGLLTGRRACLAPVANKAWPPGVT